MLPATEQFLRNALEEYEELIHAYISRFARSCLTGIIQGWYNVVFYPMILKLTCNGRYLSLQVLHKVLY
jgi:hypothetical protein